MQIVVENIFKHNAVSSDFPIHIDIYCDSKSLIIKNTRNPKKNLFEPSGRGLLNLKERYSLISELSPVFKMDEKFYIATLPLITPDHSIHDQSTDIRG